VSQSLVAQSRWRCVVNGLVRCNREHAALKSCSVHSRTQRDVEQSPRRRPFIVRGHLSNGVVHTGALTHALLRLCRHLQGLHTETVPMLAAFRRSPTCPTAVHAAVFGTGTRQARTYRSVTRSGSCCEGHWRPMRRSRFAPLTSLLLEC